MKKNVTIFLTLSSLLFMTGCGAGNESAHDAGTDVAETVESIAASENETQEPETMEKDPAKEDP